MTMRNVLIIMIVMFLMAAIGKASDTPEDKYRCVRHEWDLCNLKWGFKIPESVDCMERAAADCGCNIDTNLKCE